MKHNTYCILFFLLISLLFASCGIKGNFKGLYSYSNKTSKETPNLLYKLKNLESACNFYVDLDHKNSEPKIIVLKGKALKECLLKNEKALIYIWRPRCRSKLCIPPEIIQSTCDAKKIELYIVAEYYDSENMIINYKIKRQIFGIDTEFYETNLTKKYISKFLLDLEVNLTKDNNNNCIYFENGKFIKTYESVQDIE